MKPSACRRRRAADIRAAARTLSEIEMEHLLRVLEKHGGNKTAAARSWGSASRRCTTS